MKIAQYKTITKQNCLKIVQFVHLLKLNNRIKERLRLPPLLYSVITLPSKTLRNENKKPCYRKDDRAMRPIAYISALKIFLESLHGYAHS